MKLHCSDAFLESILEEDCPHEDITTLGLGIGRVRGTVTAWRKTAGVVAGLDAAARMFELRGGAAERLAEEGERVDAFRPVLKVSGRAEALHAVYKAAQCVMEYCSGMADRTRQMVEAARRENPAASVALTRKHFPGAKRLSLVGILAGGGIVHRHGLSDSILVFDQHRVFSGDVDRDLRRLIVSSPEHKVVVEVDSVKEALRYAALGVHVLQCERFSPEDVAALRAELRTRGLCVTLNAAGGINASNAAEYARAGADVLVTSWPYFGRPADVKMAFECDSPGVED